MTNDTEIARVLALQEKATAGPWATVGRSHDHIIICEKWRHVKLADVHSYLHPYGPSAEDRESNAAFIAAAHDMANLIRALRDERDGLRAEVARLRFRDDVFTDQGGSVAGGKTIAEIYKDEAERLRTRVAELEAASKRVGSPFPMIDATGRCFVCGNHHGNLPCPFTQAAAVDAGPTPFHGRTTRRED